MLLAFEVLPREAADWTGESVVQGINPEIIDRAMPEVLPGYDGPAVKLHVQGDEVVFVAGEIEEVLEKAQDRRYASCRKISSPGDRAAARSRRAQCFRRTHYDLGRCRQGVGQRP